MQLSIEEKQEVVENFDHLDKIRFSPQMPKAFTEKGLYILATILKSPQAVQTTIAIVEAYAKLRKLARVVAEIPQTENNGSQQKTLLKRGSELVSEIIDSTLPKQSQETSFELNLAMIKFKHSVKREQ